MNLSNPSPFLANMLVSLSTFMGDIMNRFVIATLTGLALSATNAQAAEKKKDELPPISKCAKSFGSIALTDGDSQGWTEFGLSSPRELLAAVVSESGCFNMHNAASGGGATFLMTAIAGSQEEVDKTVNAAKGAAAEGLVRSGALGRVGLGGMGGKALGMFGGLGGKKKTVVAGLRVLSPATGLTIASGSAQSSKTSLTLGGDGGWGFANKAAGAVGGYTGSKEGLQLAIAFINAYNAVVAQDGALASVPQPVAIAGPASVTTAVDTQLYAQPSKGAIVRALRAGTALTPTGKRDGLFVETKDNFGTLGWVSVEDMK
jgi:hypothetical protein